MNLIDALKKTGKASRSSWRVDYVKECRGRLEYFSEDDRHLENLGAISYTDTMADNWVSYPEPIRLCEACSLKERLDFVHENSSLFKIGRGILSNIIHLLLKEHCTCKPKKEVT